MFALWPLGRYGTILGQNRKILWLNHWKLEKMHNYFIVISISNPDKSSDEYHRLSFLMSQTGFAYFIDHFGAKNEDFLNENHEPNTYEY
jgi:hypothetical protein